MGPSWGVFGSSWAAFGPLWALFGALLAGPRKTHKIVEIFEIAGKADRMMPKPAKPGSPQMYDLLTKINVKGNYIGDGVFLEAERPIFKLNKNWKN